VLEVRFHEPLRLSLAPRITPVPTATATGIMPKPMGRGRGVLVAAAPLENGVVRGRGTYVWTSFVDRLLGGAFQCVQNFACDDGEPP
jgi:hypothetical protein